MSDGKQANQWANANNFLLRAVAELQRAHQEISDALKDSPDSPFVPPTDKQRKAIGANIRNLRSELKTVSDSWKKFTNPPR